MRPKRHRIAGETEALELSAESSMQSEQLRRAIPCRGNDDFGLAPILRSREGNCERGREILGAHRA